PATALDSWLYEPRRVRGESYVSLTWVRKTGSRPVRSPCLEVLRQLEALRLVVRAEIGAVERLRARQHVLVDEPADDLAMFEDEGHLVAADLEHGAAAGAAGLR